MTNFAIASLELACAIFSLYYHPLKLNAITPPAARGQAVGGLNTSVFLGQFFSPTLSQPLIQQTGSAATFAWVELGMSAIAVVVFAMPKIRILRGDNDSV